MKNIVFTEKGWSDFIHWSKSDRKVFEKLSILIEEISGIPFKGKGNPKPLKHKLQGYWSRRINEEHRLVYSVKKSDIQIISCKYHYQD
jgi:toxin YoeB